MALPLSRLTLLAALIAGPALGEDDGLKVWQQKVAGSEVPINIVEGVVNAPPAAVWAVVSECGNYARTMPRTVKSVELSRSGDEQRLWTVKCQQTTALPFPFSNLNGITLSTHKVEPGVRYSREWNLISGDYEINHGSWTLVGIDGGKQTLVTYKLRVKPKISLPSGLISLAQKSAIKDVILRMRETVKQPK